MTRLDIDTIEARANDPRVEIVALALDKFSLAQSGWTESAIERAMRTTAGPSDFNTLNAVIAIETIDGLEAT